jgi:hypothetical protein
MVSADLAEIDNTPCAKAENKYKEYFAFIKCKYLPEMKPLWNLLWYENGGKPREPVYSSGPVVSRGENLPTEQNHADYIDKNGSYVTVKFLKDHVSMFPTINKVATGQLCPHIMAEVDCESLFSQSGYISNP